jgi:hypothetical protein
MFIMHIVLGTRFTFCRLLTPVLQTFVAMNSLLQLC